MKTVAALKQQQQQQQQESLPKANGKAQRFPNNLLLLFVGFFNEISSIFAFLS
jgi:hypothetical protein